MTVTCITFLVLLAPQNGVDLGKLPLARCFGKDFPAYESILGRDFERNLNSMSEDRIYRTGGGSISLSKRSRAKVVTTVIVLFRKGPMNWREALRRVGLKPSQATKITGRGGMYMIAGIKHLPNGWDVWWEPNVDHSGQSEISIAESRPYIK